MIDQTVSFLHLYCDFVIWQAKTMDMHDLDLIFVTNHLKVYAFHWKKFIYICLEYIASRA